MLTTERNKTCCFTGHRPDKLAFGYGEDHEDCILLMLKLAVQIEEMRRKGVTTFISGMCIGVDIWMAETVLDLKRAYPDSGIRLVAAIPFEGQASRWSEAYQERYFRILEQADETVVLHTHYVKGCMYERDRYKVDRSTHMIAVFNGKAGGIKYIMDYAIKKGIHAIIINPDDMTRKEIPPLRDFKLI